MAEQKFMAKEMKNMEHHSRLKSVIVDNEELPVEDLAKQKAANHYDDNIFNEEV